MDQQDQQNIESRIEQTRKTVQNMFRETQSITEQAISAQCAAARAVFGFQNILTGGALTPINDRVEEGLDLYQRTVGEVQETSSRILDNTTQALTQATKEASRWAAKGERSLTAASNSSQQSSSSQGSQQQKHHTS